MLTKDQTGINGEDYAAQYLTHRGHQVLSRRWRGHYGELDLVTHDGAELVAVEVKTRRSLNFGHPVEAVDARKLHRLHRLLAQYRAEHQIRAEVLRVDVVGILFSPDTQADETAVSVEYLQDVRP